LGFIRGLVWDIAMAGTEWRLQKSHVRRGKGEARTLVWFWDGDSEEFHFSACNLARVGY
jgi:hypothetical protein